MAQPDLKHQYFDTCEKLGCNKKLSDEELHISKEKGWPGLCTEHMEWFKTEFEKCAEKLKELTL